MLCFVNFSKFILHRESCAKFLLKFCKFSRISRRMASSVNCGKPFKKFDSPQFRNLFTPELSSLADLFSRNGYEIRIAGGAVRDLILGSIPHDVDFATTATPKEMVAMFEKEEIRMINNRGEKHGTVTCRLNDKENFEVTTLRFDVETDGRHAEVQFTTNWMLDAERRDLTINSMFLGLDGTLYDYFNGEQDLFNRKVKFVGNPDDRIKEDYLRILRYFRFYGKIAPNADSHEEDILTAIKSNCTGLDGISGERLWVEIKKIMAGNFVDSILKVMNDLNVLHHLGFTGELNFDELSKVWMRCRDMNPLPMTLISAMLSCDNQLLNLHARVKMSKDELQLGQFILQHRTDPVFSDSSNNEQQKIDPMYDTNASGESKEMKKLKLDNPNPNHNQTQILLEGESIFDPELKNDSEKNNLLNKCQDLLVEEQSNLAKTKIKILELLKYFNMRDTLEELRQWNPPKFPVSGIRLIEAGVPKGPQFSRELSRLKEIWKQSRFTKTEEELLQCIKFKKKVGE